MWLLILYFICIEVGGDVDDAETVIVMERGVLNLQPGVDDLKGDVQILWSFESGRQNTRVAQIHQGKMYTHYNTQFTGRVQLEQTTGILTISDIRTNQSGLYEALIITSAHITARRYKVHVYAPVSVPSIRRNSSVSVHQSTGTQHETEDFCSVFCSVKNDRDVSISWYKGGEIVNQNSNPDLSINLSLSLDLHYNDSETYRCMAVNPVSNKSVRLHKKEICSPQEDCLDHCGVTEALVRLVLSGLVGITAVGFLIEHLMLCSSQRRAAASV
ncbi:uncharacterized protein LOC113093040 [Carassius auratus]|uniref:Uncharacterized protein LOC113093040 n=1 Tax=Carassius auratus TaxID=7957 RepID=A0A6P6P0Q6_CARAU|nr:uncharacterized protein LOC113093040 [Carassius auratus]